MTKQVWLVKTEPETYSWTTFLKDKKTDWTGVRNYQARIHLRAMKTGDHVLFYHSMTDKAVVGIAEITKPAFPDTTAEKGEDWVGVELKPVKSLKKPVSLEQIKAEAKLANMVLVKNSRLSVQPVTAEEYALIVKMGK